MPKAPCPQLYHVLLLIMKFASFFYSLLLVIAFSGASFAQTPPFDEAAFENLAERTESVLSNTTTSTESLDILRSELLLYRAETFAQQGKLIDQLAEIETALDELGDPPADDATPEPESIAPATRCPKRRTRQGARTLSGIAPIVPPCRYPHQTN